MFSSHGASSSPYRAGPRTTVGLDNLYVASLSANRKTQQDARNNRIIQACIAGILPHQSRSPATFLSSQTEGGTMPLMSSLSCDRNKRTALWSWIFRPPLPACYATRTAGWVGSIGEIANKKGCLRRPSLYFKHESGAVVWLFCSGSKHQAEYKILCGGLVRKTKRTRARHHQGSKYSSNLPCHDLQKSRSRRTCQCRNSAAAFLHPFHKGK